MASNIVTLNDDNFDEKVTKMQLPILVDFWAAWCGPCKIVDKVLEELAEELSGQAELGKVNVDENGDLVNRFGIQSIPTLIVFKGGRVVDQMVGARPKQDIRKLLEKHF